MTTRSGNRGGIRGRARQDELSRLELADPQHAALLRQQCNTKASYRDRASAKRAAKELRRVRGTGREYECLVCRCWHLTTLSPEAYRDSQRTRSTE